RAPGGAAATTSARAGAGYRISPGPPRARPGVSRLLMSPPSVPQPLQRTRRFSPMFLPFEPVPGHFREVRGLLDADEAPAVADGGDAGRAAARERVQHEVAGIAGAEDDPREQGERQLRREVRQALGVGAGQPRDVEPDVVEELAAGVGAGVIVLGLAVAGALH